MTYRICNAAIALGCLLAAESARAHHSTSLYFDFNGKQLTLTGTLTTLRWWNPHIEFSLDVKDGKGQAESWLIESFPPNILANRKIRKADFEKAIGQSVVVEFFPAKDGSRYGILEKITFPDGTIAP